MKKILLLLVLCTILNACSNEESEITGLISRWQVIESLADPGDGSGTFVPVDSDIQLDIFANGTFTANTSLCLLDLTTDLNEYFGSYDEERMVISPADCNLPNGNPLEHSYTLDRDELIITLLCIEGCALKFRRVGLTPIE